MLRRFLSISLMVACCALSRAQQAPVPTDMEYRPGQLIVKLKDGTVGTVRNGVRGARLITREKTVDDVLSSLGADEIVSLMPNIGSSVTTRRMRAFNGDEVQDRNLSQLYLITFNPEKDVLKAVSELSDLDEVEFAEPNYIVKTQSIDGWGNNDPMYSEQWGLFNARVPEMWQLSKNQKNYLGHRPVIAIIDTGVDIDHPDLADNIWTNPNETENGKDSDGNGFKDDLHGWDFVNQTGKIGDYNGHGTHCAGIAAAVGDNGIGIVGANPDALIMPITVMQSNGSGDVATIVKGIDYALANGADVLSMSIGGYQYSLAEDQALSKAYSRCVIVAAAGNDAMDIEPRFMGQPCYPGAFSYVIGVQATSSNNLLTFFSNTDQLGPTKTLYDEEKLYNYEISAPGFDILSTYPHGRYKKMNGTSMACPLVAGIVSRIIQTKEINSKEILFGDMIHTSRNLYSCMGGFYCKYGGPIDCEALFNIADEDRTPNMHVISFVVNDSLGDCDGRVDAGEIVDIYPILRNEWGFVKDSEATLTLEFGDNEDNTLCEFITNNVKIGCDVSGYGKIKSQNPIRVKMRDNIVDGRVVRFVARVECPNMSGDYAPETEEIQFKVENGIELGGTLREDITLYPGIQYIVTRNWGIPKDRKVTIKPGTVIKIKDDVGISNYGHMIFEGTADSMIVITKGDNDLGNIGGVLNDNANYCEFNYVIFENLTGITFNGHRYNNCIIRNCNIVNYPYALSVGGYFRGCEIYNNTVAEPFLGSDLQCICHSRQYPGVLSYDATFIETSIHDNLFNEGFGTCAEFYHSNYIGNEIYHWDASPDVRDLDESNCFGNYYDFKSLKLINSYYKPGFYSTIFYTTEPEIFYLSKAYLGTASDKVAYKSILDSQDNIGWGTVDVWQKSAYAYEEAPLCVDYVKVDGYDPQDQEDVIPPLGVGRHMIEIGFNRKMDQTVHPMITMGVRTPYTQVSWNEDGRWYDPWTYRAYLTITGKTATDGTNRIRVDGYKQKDQNPNFGGAIEKYRYNVLVSAAGSMSTGMMAEPGLGKVSLTWETDSADFADLMGYNLYRFTMNESGECSDSIMINKEIIESTDNEYIDYDVIPGIMYCYYIKEIGTNLVENYVSKTVSAIPLTAQKGDANGSLKVDIADVISEIAYLSNENPQPFIYEAADVNNDSLVNILDVVGTLRIITSHDAETETLDEPVIAYCYEEDGKLYLDSPVPVGGVQILLKNINGSVVKYGEMLQGMECLSADMGNGKQMVLSYSMSGVVVPSGRCELISVDGDLEVSDIVLSTTKGTNIIVMFDSVTGVEDITESDHNNSKAIFDLNGYRLNTLPENGIIIKEGKKIRL